MTIFRIIFLITVWALFIIQATKAQTGFAKVVSNSGVIENLDIDDIIYHNNKVLIRGNNFIDSLAIWGLFLAELDTNGVLLWHKTIYDQSLVSDWVANSPTRFDITKKGEIVLPNYYLIGNNLSLSVLDTFRNELFTKKYTHSGRTIYPQEVKKIDENYYLFGRVQRDDFRGDCYVLKADSLGNMIWIKYYGLKDFEEGFGGVIINPNKTFTVSSHRRTKEFYISGMQLIGWNAPWIFTIDTAGSVVQEWLGEQNDSITQAGYSIDRFPNGDWALISKDLKLIHVGFGFYEGWVSPNISRLDSNFNLIWKTSLRDYNNPWDRMWDMEYDELQDQIIVAGYKNVKYSSDQVEREIWVSKLSGDGTVLWDISDTIYSNKGGAHLTSGLALAPSGSIYVAGTVDYAGKSEGWIMKVTPDGCSDTLCTTTSLEEQIKNWDKNVVLYPNPVNDRLYVRIKELQGDADFQISDMQGRALIKKRVQAGVNSIELDLQSGMYVCTIVSSGKREYSGKIVVK